MRILVFGGSFNPPHLGHFALADHVRNSFRYDKVILVPSFRPPHKMLTDDPGPVHRFDMVQKTCCEDPHFIPDDCELRREGMSYTVDTLASIMDRYDVEGKPGLLLGDDLVPGFSDWRESVRIAEISDLIVAFRLASPHGSFPYPHREANNLILPISSSLIRQRIREGLSFRYFVPLPVYEHIVSEGLYGFA